jgi:hypothetical protein
VLFESGKKTFISRHIFHQHCYTCPIALPKRRTRSIEVFKLLTHRLPHLVEHRLQLSNVIERIYRPTCETLYATNTSNRKHEIFLYEYSLHWVLCAQKKTHNRTLFFCSTHFKNGRHFDYWNPPLNMHMRVCCLDCHEAGSCCYLMLNIEKLLRPLQVFCFHFWPIYWLFFLTLHLVWCVVLWLILHDHWTLQLLRARRYMSLL